MPDPHTAPEIVADAALPPDDLFGWLTTDDLVVPMLPALAHQVIELASDPDVSISRLSALVSKEQVIASRVLGLANSAFSAPLQEISTVHEAIVRLGTSAIRNVVVTVCFTSRMHDPAVYGGHGGQLVDHAIGTAYVARLLAERVRVGQDEAFLCGLLHDIGKLVILKLAHDHRRRTGTPLPDAIVELAILERHAAMGGLALRRWRLPSSLEAPVVYHHEYTAAPSQRRETAVAYAANRLAHRYGFGCDVDQADILDDPVCEELGIDAAWLAMLDERAPGLFEIARKILT